MNAGQALISQALEKRASKLKTTGKALAVTGLVGGAGTAGYLKGKSDFGLLKEDPEHGPVLFGTRGDPMSKGEVEDYLKNLYGSQEKTAAEESDGDSKNEGKEKTSKGEDIEKAREYLDRKKKEDSDDDESNAGDAPNFEKESNAKLEGIKALLQHGFRAGFKGKAAPEAASRISRAIVRTGQGAGGAYRFAKKNPLTVAGGAGVTGYAAS